MSILPEYSQFTNIVFSISVFIFDIICIRFLCKVFRKKRDLKNKNINTSYCKISDWILTLLAINMLIYVIFMQGGVAFSWYSTFYCGIDSASKSCSQSKYLKD